jgi:phosphate-selective porin OprO/OprP
MFSRKRSVRVALLGSAALLMATPGQAQDIAARLSALETQIEALTRELAAVRPEAAAQAARAAEAAAAAEQARTVTAQIADLNRSGPAPQADSQNQPPQDPRVTLTNARPTFATPDGAFNASLRGLMQYDYAYFAGSGTEASPDLSSGTNFRRARLGLEGRFFTDWLYSFVLDVGGSSGVEQQGRISDFYVQYEGFAPLRLRTGAYATPAGLEDQGTADLLFAERAAPADLARQLAAADGRQNFVTALWNNENWYAAMSVTGARSAEPLPQFDEQQALVGRLAARIYHDADSNVVLSGSGTYVYKVADAAATPGSASPVTLQIVPETNVDGQRLISTGPINADNVTVLGLEAGANLQTLYVQGGYFTYGIGRRASALPDPGFDGWYAQASWVLTGEPRRYNPATASWMSPLPATPRLANGGIGAWEVAARYSEVDLDYRPGSAGSIAPSGGIRGGVQNAWTVGVNWYPNSVLRFAFDYQRVDIDRLSTTAPFAEAGGALDIVSARTQAAF